MCARLLVSLVALALAAPAPALAADAGTDSLPAAGFDVGRMAAVAMLMVGAGLLISAMAGPRPRRAAQLR